MRLYALFQWVKGMIHSSMMSQDWATAVSWPTAKASRAKKLSSKVRGRDSYSLRSSQPGRLTRAVSRRQRRLVLQARDTAPSRHSGRRTALSSIWRLHQRPGAASRRWRPLSE